MPQRIVYRMYTKLPPGTKVVMRASRWGNPYRMIEHGGPYTRAEALQRFETYARARLREEPHWLDPLRGFDLACVCPTGEACHGDLLLILANAPQSDAPAPLCTTQIGRNAHAPMAPAAPDPAGE